MVDDDRKWMQDMTEITRRVDALSNRLTVVEMAQKHIDEKFAATNERMDDIKMMIREGFLDVKASFQEHKRDVKEKISAVKEDTENSKRPRLVIMAAAAGAFATGVVNFILSGGLKGG